MRRTANYHPLECNIAAACPEAAAVAGFEESGLMTALGVCLPTLIIFVGALMILN